MTKDELEEVLREGVGPQRFLSVEDLAGAGVPRRHAGHLSKATMRMDSTEDAGSIAEDYARRFAADAEGSLEMNPAKLADGVPRY